MKKLFIKKVGLLLAIIVAIDGFAGVVFNKLDRPDNPRSNKYFIEKVDAPLLVFGSSRAYRHYSTMILTDSLGLSSYNCGLSAQCFIHNYVILEEILDRYTPEFIIYDLNPKVDFIESGHAMYISSLRPYKENKHVSEVLFDVDPLERIKTVSNLYCYNYMANSIIWDLFNLPLSESYNGFVPTDRIMNREKVGEDVVSTKVDPLKMKYADLFAEKAKKTKFICVISPRWYGMDERHIQMAKEFSKKHSIPLLNFANDSLFVHNDSLFYDGTHLNSRGALVFSNMLVQTLKTKSLVQ